MSQLIDPSLTAWYPFKDNPTLEAAQGIGPDLTHVRATKATFREENGFIREIQTGNARFDNCKYRANLLHSTHRWADTTVGYSVTNATAYLQETHTPDGHPATRLSNAAGGVGQYHYCWDSLTNRVPTDNPIGKELFQSYVVKKIQGTGYVWMLAQGARFLWFDLNKGEYIQQTGGGLPWLSYGITDLGDDWYRIWGTYPQTTATVAPGMGMAEDLANPNWDSTGKADQEQIYVGEPMCCDASGLHGRLGAEEVTPTQFPYLPNTGTTDTVSAYEFTGSNDGLIIEPASTNICLQSEDFGTTWTTTRTSIDTTPYLSVSGDVAPDGSRTADRIVEDGTAASSHFISMAGMNLTADTWTVSIFAKAINRNWFYIDVADGGATNIAYFDLANGVVGSTSGALSSEIEDYGDGWYRCSMTWSALATAAGNIRPGIASADLAAVFDGLSQDSISVWGCQLENLPRASSYIRTTTTSVTRNMEVVEALNVGTDVLQQDGSVGCTMYADGVPVYGNWVIGWFYTLGAGDNNDSRTGLYTASTQANGRSYTGSVSQLNSAIAAAATDRTRMRLASNFKTDYCYAAADGTGGNTDTSGTYPTDFDSIQIGNIPSNSATNTFFGTIGEVRHYNEAKSDAFIDDLSNGLISPLDVSPSYQQLKGMHLSSLPTSTDARWKQIILDSGITESGDFIDDCHQALEALTGDTGDLATLYKKYARQFIMWDSETLQGAGGVNPNRDFSEAWNFEAYPTLTGIKGTELSSTRATTATVKTADDKIVWVDDDIPRFQGATFEENLLDTTDLSQWGLSGSPEPTEVEGPLGLRAWRITDNDASGYEGIVKTFTVPDDTSVYLCTFYWHEDDTGYGGINASISGGTAVSINARMFAPVYPDDGEVPITCSGNSSGSGGARYVGDGWYQGSFTIENNGTGNTNFSITLYGSVRTSRGGGDTTAGVGYSTYAGVQVQQGIRQLGTAFADPGTFIPTSGTAVQRFVGAGDGLLIEEARTNIQNYSAEFSNASWVKIRSVITADSTTAPDGSETADTLTDDSSTGTNNARCEDAITTATSTAYTVSCFMKADQLNWGAIEIAGSGALSIIAYYDLVNGVVGATVGADNDDQGIEDYGNGWYRCWITFTSDAVDTSAIFRIYVADGNNDLSIDLDGTSSIFIWGAQLEAGTTPSSYIPTEATSVTRNRDQVTTTDLSWFDASTNSTYTKSAAVGYDNDVRIVYEVGDGTTNNRHVHYYNSDDPAFYSNSSGSGASLIGSGFNNGLDMKTLEIASAFAVNDVAAYSHRTRPSEGETLGTDSSAAAPVGSTTMFVGYDWADDNYLNGVVKVIAFWDERMNDTWLERVADGSLIIK